MADIDTHSIENKASRQGGFVLALTIIFILGVTAISVGTLFNAKTGRMSSANYEMKLQNFLAADGMVTLLTQEIINGNGSKYIDASRFGKIKGHVWIFIGGNTIKNLTDVIKVKPNPDLVVSSHYLGNDVDHDNYGAKWFGYLVPPLTGNYTFYTRSDDASAFFLSKDTSALNLSKNPICSLATWVYQWPTSGSGVSKPIPLIAGKRYYFEYLHKEGGGFDFSQMGWDGPNQFSERPITGRYLSEYSSDPEWNGTFNIGAIPVRYQVTGNGSDNFNVKVEAVTTKLGNAKDTTVRTPLTQHISMVAQATAPPPTMDMPVIYYDFLSNGSNPEFNQPVTLGRFQGMVNNKLTNFTATDANYFGRTTIGKPTKSNAFHPNRSCGLNMWFRSSTPTNFAYRYGPGDNCTQTVFAINAWSNTKRYGNLTFTLDTTQGKHTYVFSRMGNYNTGVPETSWRGDPSEFFPLNTFGQDPAGSGNNYGFCMEMHTTFTHQSGLKFEFTGDDDAWAFVNDSLVIDLGGIHGALNDLLVLDNLPLQFGQTYNFDFFQCERQQVNSSSRIVTNIKMKPNLGKPVANWRRDYGRMD